MSRHTETPEYAKFVRRALRAYGKRVADADEVDLTELLMVKEEFDQTVAMAVQNWHRAGHSWADVGKAAGVSRQAAFQRWGYDDAVSSSG